MLLAWGHSHRTTADAELIRWGSDAARAEGAVARAEASDSIEVTLVRPGSAVSAAGGRKRIRVNGVPRRPAALGAGLRVVLFAPEEMLLIAGAPGLRRAAIDRLAASRSPAFAAAIATYGRALQQRNALLRAIREDPSAADQLRTWDRPFLEAGGEIVARRLALLADLATPLAAAHREIAPDEAAPGGLGLRYETNAPASAGESVHDALVRRLEETAEKEVWNGATLVGPHRDDIVFELGGRDLATFASRGQQRTAILAFKLAEMDLLTQHDGRPPLLLLDDVFSELDPERRAHLVRRIGELPQAFITTTTPADLDPELVAIATGWEVRPDARGAVLDGPREGAADRVHRDAP